jgi:glycosyltransferase involved in cell wall biosynthesis
MRDLLTDGRRRDRLSAAGRERAAGFGWDRSAEALEAAYRRALAQPVAQDGRQ